MNDYKKLGDGWCRPARCDVTDSNCRVSGFWKDETSSEECQSMCSEVSCGSYASSSSLYDYPNRCYIHGAGSERAGWNSFPQTETVAKQTSGIIHVECFERIGNY